MNRDDEETRLRLNMDSSDNSTKDGEDKSTETDKPEEMLYSVEDTPPIATSLVLGFQHMMMSFGGIVGLPLLMAPSLCMFETNEGLIGRGLVINTMLFASGMCTFIQTTFGIRLPIMQGAPFTFISASVAMLNTPAFKCPAEPYHVAANSTDTTLYIDNDGDIVDGTELWQRRLRRLQGSMAICGLIQMTLGATGIIGFIIKFISPITVAVCIVLIGIGLADAGYNYSSLDWRVASFTAVVLIITSMFLSDVEIPFFVFGRKKKCRKVKVKFFKMFPVIITLGLGWLAAYAMTAAGVYTDDRNDPQYFARTDARSHVLANSLWFRIPYPFQWGGISVSITGVIGLMAALLAGILESIGDYYTTARVSQAPVPPTHAINRGVFMEGVGILINSLLGTAGATTSYSNNSSAIGITRVGSRSVLQAAGILLMLLGLFGKIGAAFVMIPNQVLGGMFMVVLGILTGMGASNLQNVNLHSQRTVFVFGFAIYLGVMVPEYLKQNPDVLKTGVKEVDEILFVLLTIPMLVGGLTSLFFDITLPGQRPSFHSKDVHTEEDKEAIRQRTEKCYNLPFSTNFRFAKYVPILPQRDGY